MENNSETTEINVNSNKILHSHHIQQELCKTRALYRQGRKLTAVKVYTINNESQHLLLFQVPKINLYHELKALCEKYGELRTLEQVKNYKTEIFTECYHAQFKRIQSARIAKRFLDNKSFYGDVLHVCYAPEFETIAETREKLKQRETDVRSRLQPGPTVLDYITMTTTDTTLTAQNRKRKHPAIPITEKRLKTECNDQIWEGIPAGLDPRLSTNEKNITKHFQMKRKLAKGVQYGPYIPTDLSNNQEQAQDEIPAPYSTAELNLFNNQPKKQTHTTLVPTMVIKNHKQDYNKRIVFRQK